MAQLVQKRIEAIIDERDAAVLLVGRGSSDIEPILKLKEIGTQVEQRIQLPVYTAFLAAYHPKVNQSLSHLQHQYKMIYVMPYLLFTGLLLKSIERMIAHYPHSAILCQNLQFDDLMKQTLLARIGEKR